jgi:hypothetical protein
VHFYAGTNSDAHHGTDQLRAYFAVVSLERAIERVGVFPTEIRVPRELQVMVNAFDLSRQKPSQQKWLISATSHYCKLLKGRRPDMQFEG